MATNTEKMILSLAAAFAAAVLFADAYVVIHPEKCDRTNPIGKAINDVRSCLEFTGCKFTAADYPQVTDDLLRDTKVLFLHSDLAPQGKAKDAIAAYEGRGGKVNRLRARRTDSSRR